MADPLDPFDDELFRRVADRRDLPESDLRDAVRALHDHVEALSGVDELVHDWRTGLPYDPVVTRTSTAYYLAFNPSVWTEFAAQLDWEETTLAAVRSLHDRQARRAAERRGDPVATYEGAAPMVLARYDPASSDSSRSTR